MESTRSWTLLVRWRKLSCLALLVSLTLLLVGTSSAGADSPVLRLIRVIETSETLGLPDTAGSAFPPHVDSLLVLKGRSPMRSTSALTPMAA